jgi:hypothetical protein
LRYLCNHIWSAVFSLIIARRGQVTAHIPQRVQRSWSMRMGCTEASMQSAGHLEWQPPQPAQRSDIKYLNDILTPRLYLSLHF